MGCVTVHAGDRGNDTITVMGATGKKKKKREGGRKKEEERGRERERNGQKDVLCASISVS